MRGTTKAGIPTERGKALEGARLTLRASRVLEPPWIFARRPRARDEALGMVFRPWRAKARQKAGLFASFEAGLAYLLGAH